MIMVRSNVVGDSTFCFGHVQVVYVVLHLSLTFSYRQLFDSLTFPLTFVAGSLQFIL